MKMWGKAFGMRLRFVAAWRIEDFSSVGMRNSA